MQDAPVGEQAGGVGEVLAGGAAVAVHVADHRAEAGRHGVLQAAQRLAVLLHEGGVVEQVHRRVAAQAQLGKHHQVGVQGARLVHPGKNARAVAGKVADGGVDLGEGDAHRLITPETTRTSDLRFRKPLLYPTELLGRGQAASPSIAGFPLQAQAASAEERRMRRISRSAGGAGEWGSPLGRVRRRCGRRRWRSGCGLPRG